MTAQNTPGPWAVHHHESTDTYTIHVEGRSWESWGVAHIGYTKEDDANARLIAAAPELLKAARLVIAWYEAEDDHSKADFYQRMTMCRESEAALRAAIAKATGGAV